MGSLATPSRGRNRASPNADGRYDVGQFFIAIDPGRFRDQGDFGCRQLGAEAIVVEGAIGHGHETTLAVHQIQGEVARNIVDDKSAPVGAGHDR